MNYHTKNIFFLITLLTLFGELYSQCLFPNNDGKTPPAYEKLKPLVGRRYTAYDLSGEFRYSIGICTDAMPEILKSDEGVVQIKNDNSGSESKVVIGKYTNAIIKAGTNWVYLEYTDGETYHKHCQHESRKAVILFTCDPEATDNTPGMKMLEEQRNASAGCYYLFELAHPEVCNIKISSSLSVGSITLIVFFCVMGVYLIAGGLYQRFVLGAKGIEQLPNYEFWKDFGNLQADGCNFICRSEDSRHSSPYKGLGDDQLEEPEERDDNLLPM